MLTQTTSSLSASLSSFTSGKYKHIEVLPIDINTCQNSNWLNSTVVYGCSLILKDKLGVLDSDVAIMDPLIASLIFHEQDEEDLHDLIRDSKSGENSTLMLIPLNNQVNSKQSGDHWSLLIRVIIPNTTSGSNMVFFHVCSLGKPVPTLGTVVAKKLLAYHKESAKRISSPESSYPAIEEIPLQFRQHNSHDCGVYVYLFIEQILGSIQVIKEKLSPNAISSTAELQAFLSEFLDQGSSGFKCESTIKVRAKLAEVLLSTKK